jgi:hypothetical protein
MIGSRPKQHHLYQPQCRPALRRHKWLAQPSQAREGRSATERPEQGGLERA